MATWILLITNMVLFFTTTCLCSNDLYEKEQVPLDVDNLLRVDLHTEPEYQSKVSKFTAGQRILKSPGQKNS